MRAPSLMSLPHSRARFFPARGLALRCGLGGDATRRRPRSKLTGAFADGITSS